MMQTTHKDGSVTVTQCTRAADAIQNAHKLADQIPESDIQTGYGRGNYGTLVLTDGDPESYEAVSDAVIDIWKTKQRHVYVWRADDLALASQRAKKAGRE